MQILHSHGGANTASPRWRHAKQGSKHRQARAVSGAGSVCRVRSVRAPEGEVRWPSWRSGGALPLGRDRSRQLGVMVFARACLFRSAQDGAVADNSRAACNCLGNGCRRGHQKPRPANRCGAAVAGAPVVWRGGEGAPEGGGAGRCTAAPLTSRPHLVRLACRAVGMRCCGCCQWQVRCAPPPAPHTIARGTAAEGPSRFVRLRREWRGSHRSDRRRGTMRTRGMNQMRGKQGGSF